MPSSDFQSRTKAPLITCRPFDLELVVDRSSVEAFAQDGTVVMTDLVFPPSQENRVVVFSNRAGAVRVRGTMHQLRSVWK